MTKNNEYMDILINASASGKNKYEVFREKYPIIKERIYHYIKCFNHVSFAELNKLLTDKEREGDCSMHVKDHPSWVFWICMSDEYYNAVHELSLENMIEFEPCKTFVGGMPLVYMIDGELLRLPIVKKAIDYKTGHWIPGVWILKTNLNQNKIKQKGKK